MLEIDGDEVRYVSNPPRRSGIVVKGCICDQLWTTAKSVDNFGQGWRKGNDANIRSLGLFRRDVGAREHRGSAGHAQAQG